MPSAALRSPLGPILETAIAGTQGHVRSGGPQPGPAHRPHQQSHRRQAHPGRAPGQPPGHLGPLFAVPQATPFPVGQGRARVALDGRLDQLALVIIVQWHLLGLPHLELRALHASLAVGHGDLPVVLASNVVELLGYY